MGKYWKSIMLNVNRKIDCDSYFNWCLTCAGVCLNISEKRMRFPPRTRIASSHRLSTAVNSLSAMLSEYYSVFCRKVPDSIAHTLRESSWLTSFLSYELVSELLPIYCTVRTPTDTHFSIAVESVISFVVELATQWSLHTSEANLSIVQHIDEQINTESQPNGKNRHNRRANR